MTQHGAFLLNLSVTPDGVPPPLSRGGLGMGRKASSLRQRLPSVGELSSECETERLFQNDPPDEPPKPSESVDEPPEELDSFLGGS